LSFRSGPLWLGVGCALVLLGCLSSCLGDFGIDDARFACTTDPQCGAGGRCVAGVCVVGDAIAPDSEGDSADAVTALDTGDTSQVDSDSEVETSIAGFMCQAETPGATSGGQASFRVERRDADGRAVLVVTYQDLTTTVPLPPDMPVDFDTAGALGPLETCCENPCCPPYSSP